MKTLWMLALCVAGIASAQDEPDRRVENQVNRLKEQLKLTDDQATKIREILVQNEKEREEKIAGLLNDDQKKLYEEQRRNGRQNPGPGGGGRGGRNFLGGFGIDQLKEELSLNEEQTAKIKDIVDKFREDAQKKMDELRERGFRGFNWQEEVTKALTDLGNKIKEHLTPDQKEKFDKIVEERTRFMRPGGGGERPNRFVQRPPIEERTKQAMDALKIADGPERAAVQELVTKVLRAKDEAEDYDREYREKVRDLARGELGEEALEEKLREFRDERKKREKALSAAQRDLNENVTFRQEVLLIEHGLLR